MRLELKERVGIVSVCSFSGFFWLLALKRLKPFKPPYVYVLNLFLYGVYYLL
jgi:hypothetical protein